MVKREKQWPKTNRQKAWNNRKLICFISQTHRGGAAGAGAEREEKKYSPENLLESYHASRRRLAKKYQRLSYSCISEKQCDSGLLSCAVTMTVAEAYAERAEAVRNAESRERSMAWAEMMTVSSTIIHYLCIAACDHASTMLRLFCISYCNTKKSAGYIHLLPSESTMRRSYYLRLPFTGRENVYHRAYEAEEKIPALLPTRENTCDWNTWLSASGWSYRGGWRRAKLKPNLQRMKIEGETKRRKYGEESRSLESYWKAQRRKLKLTMICERKLWLIGWSWPEEKLISFLFRNASARRNIFSISEEAISRVGKLNWNKWTEAIIQSLKKKMSEEEASQPLMLNAISKPGSGAREEIEERNSYLY